MRFSIPGGERTTALKRSVGIIWVCERRFGNQSVRGPERRRFTRVIPPLALGPARETHARDFNTQPNKHRFRNR
jgi:hypothetical protein